MITHCSTEYYLNVRTYGIKNIKYLLSQTDFKDVESNNRFYCADKYMRIDMIDYISNM